MTATDIVPDLHVFRLSVDQYLDIVRAGILTPEDRVELLEGVLVEKMGKNLPHFIVTNLIHAALIRILPVDWSAVKEDPVTTPDSVPEPDCLIIRGTIRDYLELGRLPTATDVALVVEVSDTSLARDRGTKRRAYARAGLPIYWLANLVDGRFEVHTDPTGPADEPTYRQVEYLGPGEELPVILDGREVARLAVSDLLP